MKSIEKKIKKDKPLAPISEDEIPFKIPENWRWMKFGLCVENHDAERKPVSKDKRISHKGTYLYYGATGAIDVVDDYIFDGEYLMKAEKYLFNEMSVALKIPYEESKEYFMNGINKM